MSYDKLGYYYDDAKKCWIVRLEDAEDGSDSWFDCDTQYEAEVLSRLTRIEAMIKQHEMWIKKHVY